MAKKSQPGEIRPGPRGEEENQKLAGRQHQPPQENGEEPQQEEVDDLTEGVLGYEAGLAEEEKEGQLAVKHPLF